MKFTFVIFWVILISVMLIFLYYNYVGITPSKTEAYLGIGTINVIAVLRTFLDKYQ